MIIKNKRVFISGGAGVIGIELVNLLSKLAAIILVGDPSRLTGVECLTDSSQIPRIRQISSGQKVLVKGYGDKSNIHVRLKGCRLLDSQSNLAEDSLDSEHDGVQEREQPKENS